MLSSLMHLVFFIYELVFVVLVVVYIDYVGDARGVLNFDCLA